MCITGVGHPFPASWDSLPRTTASDNRAGPFLTMSRPFSTLAVYCDVGTHETESLEGQRATKEGRENRENERRKVDGSGTRTRDD